MKPNAFSLPVWHRFGMCDVFLFATDSAADQTKPISLLIGCHSKSILGQASMFQMGRCKQPTGMAERASMNLAATKTFFFFEEFVWTREGGGPGGKSQGGIRRRDLAGIQPQLSPCHPSPQAPLQISSLVTKDVFWKMKLHIEDTAIFDGYSACLQIPA